MASFHHLVRRYYRHLRSAFAPVQNLLVRSQRGLAILLGHGTRRAITITVTGLLLALIIALNFPTNGEIIFENIIAPPELGRLLDPEEDPAPLYDEPLGEGGYSFAGIVEEKSNNNYDEEDGYSIRDTWIPMALIPPLSAKTPIRIRLGDEIGTPGVKWSNDTIERGDVNINFTPSFDWEATWINTKEIQIHPLFSTIPQDEEIFYEISSKGSTRGYFNDKGSFRVGEFQMGGKFGRSAAQLGEPRAITILNGHTEYVAADGAYILFDQVVKPEELIARAVNSDNKYISTRLESVTKIPMDDTGLIDPAHVLFLRFTQRQEPHTALTISVRAKITAGLTKEFNLIVARPLSWTVPDFESTGYLELNGTYPMEFSAPVDLAKVNQHLVLSELGVAGRSSASCYSKGNNEYILDLNLNWGGRYDLFISPGFVDELGRTFGDNPRLNPNYTLKAKDKTPKLIVPMTALVLEEGQDRIPVRLLNPGAIKLRIDRYGNAQDYILALQGAKGPEPNRYKSIDIIDYEGSGNDYQNEEFRAELGIDGSPGLKRVDVGIRGVGSEASEEMRKTVLVQTTGIALSAKLWRGKVMAWAVDMGTARPLEGLKVILYKSDASILEEATTDGDGTAVLNAPEGQERQATMYLAVTHGKDIAITRLSEEDLSSPWQFNLPGLEETGQVLPAALFTERGAYRPGETVNFKIFLRPAPVEQYSNVSFTIKNARGMQVFNENHDFDAFLGAHSSFELGKFAETGTYTLEARVNEQVRRTSFNVEEYRVPTFGVDLSSPERFETEKPAAITVSAQYLRGGALDGRELSWRVYRQPEMYRSPRFPDYIFGLYPGAAMTGTVARGEDRLNADGEATIGFTPDHPSEEGQMRYIVEASVSDVDRQVYAGRISQLVETADLRIGLKPLRQNLYRDATIIRMPFIVLDRLGNPLAGQKVTVQLNKVEYHTVTMENAGGTTQTFNRTVFQESDLGIITSEKGPKNLAIKVNGTGSWQLKLLTTDKFNRTVATEYLFSVWGDSESPWPRFDRERYELMADRDEYRIGETAKIMAQSPYKNTVGLLSIEAAGVLSHRVVRIDGNTPAFDVPITADMAPNAFISLVLLRPRVHSEADGTGFQTGAPGYKIGYTSIRVLPTNESLQVSIHEKPEVSSAGQEYSFVVKAKNSNGRPISGNACVMVVDEAVLRLTGYQTPDPITLTWVARGLGVRNSSNVLDMPYSRRVRNESLFPGGDSDVAALLRAADQHDRESAVRRMFLSTAYWNPTLLFDSEGTARVTFKLPDNLTTYRIMVVASDGKGSMGSTQGSFVCQKPLTIQPFLPRFAYTGDNFRLDVQVANGDSKDALVQVDATFQGLTVIGEAPSSRTVKAGAYEIFSWFVTVDKPGLAHVNFHALSSQAEDAISLELPIRAVEISKTKVLSQRLAGESPIELPIPEDRLKESLFFDLKIDSEPLSSLQNSLDYLLEYPHGCIEQTSSRAYPLVVLSELLPRFGVTIDPDAVRTFATAGIQRVQTFTTPSGGLSYWPGGIEPHPYGSVFGLLILTEGYKRGYPVNPDTMRRLAEWLESALSKSPRDPLGENMYDMSSDNKAFAILALGRAGRPQPGMIESLWWNQDSLTIFAKATLATAAREIKGMETLADEILRELQKDIGISWQDFLKQREQTSRQWAMDSPVRDTAALLLAFVATNPQAPETIALVDRLLELLSSSSWYNTQDNIFGMMALCAMYGNGKPGTFPGGDINVNGQPFSLNGNTIQLSEADFPTNMEKIAITMPTYSGVHFATFQTRWLVADSAVFRARQNKGYEVERSYETLEGEALGGKTLPLGKLLVVRLKVRADESKNYFALTDWLPAGLEPVNTALASTGNQTGTWQAGDVARQTAQLISFRDIRDHSVSIYANELPRGNHEFVYFARATTQGTFRRPGTMAEAMYEDFMGRSETDFVTIKSQ